MSSIEWTGETWNPIVGCTKVSAGCKNCYAEKMHKRLTAMGQAKYADPFNVVKPWPAHLDKPLRRKKPTSYFVNSMGDLFHKDVPDGYIAAVFGVMAACPQHTFQVLTKRVERMLDWISPAGWLGARCQVEDGIQPLNVIAHYANKTVPGWRHGGIRSPAGRRWPLPNVWLLTSIEDQATADERIPLLLQCPAAVHGVSAEPLLAPVEIAHHMLGQCPSCDADVAYVCRCPANDGLDWVIVGGESGTGARTCDVDWIRSIVRQCSEAEVKCYVKQLGAAYCDPVNGIAGPRVAVPQEYGGLHRRLKHSKGADPSEWPADLRVREMPS